MYGAGAARCSARYVRSCLPIRHSWQPATCSAARPGYAAASVACTWWPKGMTPTAIAARGHPLPRPRSLMSTRSRPGEETMSRTTMAAGRPCPDRHGRPDQRVRFERTGHRAVAAATTPPPMHEKAVKFAECMRNNGVSGFPDPSASGKLTIDAVRRLVAGHEHPGVQKALSACKALEPPGSRAASGAPSSRRRRLKFAQCIRDNGVTDFPDPINGSPSSTRIESHPPQNPGV